MKSILINAFSLMFLCASCDKPDDNSKPNDNTSDELLDNVLSETALKVIVPTYADLDKEATKLFTTISELQKEPTEANIEKARNQWKATRIPWETSEGFLYGPADTKNLDPSLDSWPVDINAMNAIILSSENITAELIAKNNDARGFHLVEYLLWGSDGSAKASDLNTRELEYLKAATEDLQKNIKELYDSWSPEGNNYAANFTDAINGIYKSRKIALQEIIGGLIAICDEVANSKITNPLNEGKTPKPEEEESQFSNNSKRDFADDLRSVNNVYLGVYGSFQGQGVSSIVKSKNEELDAEIRQLITESIQSIESIPGTFSQAIFDEKNKVKAAINKINELQKILEEELNPLITKL